MPDLKNAKLAIPLVVLAGLLWSFGPLVVRHMDEPGSVPWQYLFARGLVIFILLNVYLYFEEGLDFFKNYFKIGASGLIGGIGSWNSNDHIYLVYYQYNSSNYVIMSSSYAFYYCFIRFFVF